MGNLVYQLYSFMFASPRSRASPMQVRDECLGAASETQYWNSTIGGRTVEGAGQPIL